MASSGDLVVGAPAARPHNIELTFPNDQIEDLMNVRGIGEKSFLILKPLVTVTAPKAAR